MARKSAASLTVVPYKAPGDGRLAAPQSLSDRERLIWTKIVASKPADWFSVDTEALLTGYVTAIVSYERLSEQIKLAEIDDIDTKGMNQLQSMQERQARLMQSFATKLRLTQQSRYTPQAAATQNKLAAGVRPWD